MSDEVKTPVEPEIPTVEPLYLLCPMCGNDKFKLKTDCKILADKSRVQLIDHWGKPTDNFDPYKFEEPKANFESAYHCVKCKWPYGRYPAHTGDSQT